MALVLADRVKETTTTTGTGTVTLAGAASGFRSFSVIGNGNTTYYTIAGQGTSEWEVGLGTYNSSGTTLSRDTVFSSSVGGTTKTNFSAGIKDVFVTYPSSKSAYFDGTSLVFKDNTSQPTAATGFGFKNRIINGAMVIDQRNAGASVSTSSATSGNYQLDRWKTFVAGTAVVSSQQSSTAPTGYINSILYTVSTADASIAAGDLYVIEQPIEGLNCSDLGFGGASAATVTLSFWVRSSITGTYCGALTNSAENRAYIFTYTISAANTWEQKTITVAGDTSGTWLTTSGIGIRVRFTLAAGSTFQGTASTWSASNVFATSSQTQWVSTNAATFYITGVQLEKGSTATSFDYRPYGTELALCQRYYATGNYPVMRNFTGTTIAVSTSTALPVTMRATPTVTASVGTVETAYTNVISSYQTSIGSGASTATSTYTAAIEL